MIWTVELLVHFFLVDFEIDVFDSLTVLPFAFGMTWKDSFVFESKITFIVTRTLCTGIEMSHQSLCEHDHPFLLLLFNGASHSILAVYIRTTTVKVYVGFFMLPSFPLLYICCELRLCALLWVRREENILWEFHGKHSVRCATSTNKQSILHKISIFLFLFTTTRLCSRRPAKLSRVYFISRAKWALLQRVNFLRKYSNFVCDLQAGKNRHFSDIDGPEKEGEFFSKIKNFNPFSRTQLFCNSLLCCVLSTRGMWN